MMLRAMKVSGRRGHFRFQGDRSKNESPETSIGLHADFSYLSWQRGGGGHLINYDINSIAVDTERSRQLRRRGTDALQQIEIG